MFSIPVPAAAQPGTQIQVTATATDLANNTSGPASLTLTVISSMQVTLPSSAIVTAGETLDVDVQMSQAAPAGGTRIDFTAADADVAGVPAFVVIPEGQTTGTLSISGLSGGSTQIRALIAGAQRAAMTVAVNGGIVKGLVRDALLNPVAGVELTISGGGTTQSAVTESTGHYRVDGVAGPDVSVRALDPVTPLYGHAHDTMARPNGFAWLPVVLIPAAAIHGSVSDGAGAPVGAGVRVDIFEVNTAELLDTVFTNAGGEYAFPLVTLGQYRLDASATDGRRGRTTVLLDASGRDVTANIAYLGTGKVSGTVRNGPVPHERDPRSRGIRQRGSGDGQRNENGTFALQTPLVRSRSSRATRSRTRAAASAARSRRTVRRRGRVGARREGRSQTDGAPVAGRRCASTPEHHGGRTDTIGSTSSRSQHNDQRRMPGRAATHRSRPASQPRGRRAP